METAATTTTLNQTEGPPRSHLRSKSKQFKPSKTQDPPERNPAPVDPPTTILEVSQVQPAPRTGNRMHTVVPLTLIVIWLTIVFLYFRL